MSVIASDGKTVAADSRASVDNMYFDDAIKLKRHSNGLVYGLTGPIIALDALIAWHAAGAVIAKYPHHLDQLSGYTFCVFYYDCVHAYSNKCPLPDKCKYPFAAGSGHQFAYGALDNDITPSQAVRCAISRDNGCGGEVQTEVVPTIKSTDKKLRVKALRKGRTRKRRR